MPSLSILAVGSFALRCGCSYFGARPKNSILTGICGQMVFFFRPELYDNLFFRWLNDNFQNYFEERDLVYKGKTYKVVFLSIHQRVSKKFLFNFKKFSLLAPHYIHYQEVNMIIKKNIDKNGIQIVSDNFQEAIRLAEDIYKKKKFCAVIHSKNLYYIESPAMILRPWERLIWLNGKEVRNEF